MRMPVIWPAIAPLVASIAERVDRRWGWDRLPRVVGSVTLLGLRHRLRERNLYGSNVVAPPPPAGRAKEAAFEATRTIDGSYNDLELPSMGAAGTRFGRNAVALPEPPSAITRPSPADVSEKLFTRDEFLPATELNLLAAAWVQFEVHDWFAHRTQRDPEERVERDSRGRGPAPALKRDPASTAGAPFYLSDQTHWWDASQLYGADERFAQALRSDRESGEVEIDEALLKRVEQFMQPSGDDEPGESARVRVPNLWIGLALFHLVFAREHNAICARLRSNHPTWDGDRLYNQARLINAAVMAKIHTVEWTPAIIAHPTTIHGIRSTWWGVLGERFRTRHGRMGPGEILSGIPGSPTNHDGAPYSLTEEFVAVYRMHPLVPDTVTFHHAGDGAPLDLEGGPTLRIEDLAVAPGHPERPRERLSEIGLENALYSLAITHPGALTLHNYPTFLQNLPRFDGGGTVDVGELDIQRTRECALPRYNDFRRAFRLAPARSFTELADGNAALADDISRVYGGDLEAVDLLVGLLAERKPRGFAFSDTAFRVFLLMAARRLRSDRFFTNDYTPAVYTPEGLEWIENATLAGILARHYPGLRSALAGVENVFKPWPTVGATA